MDTRSPALKRQHDLFQALGTMARAKFILDNLARPKSYWSYPVRITPLQQRVLDAAVYTLQDISERVREEMQTLPSKKNLKLARAKQNDQNKS